MADATSLRNVYLFSRLSDERLVEVESALQERSLAAGEVLFNQGDAGDELFIVQDGHIAIYSPSLERPGQEKPIRIFRHGGVLGDMALVDGQPRSLSARAETPATVLALGGDDFRRLIRTDPELAFAVMFGLSDRIRYTTEFLNEVRGWVSRVTQGEYNRDEFLTEVRNWVKSVAEGDYEEALKPAATAKDQNIAVLAAEFAQMAAQVQKREAQLRREIAQLKIEIDHAKRRQEVEEITGTDYFQNLRAKAKELRQVQTEEDSDG
jgi:CRP-like cAMP-binding protein